MKENLTDTPQMEDLFTHAFILAIFVTLTGNICG